MKDTTKDIYLQKVNEVIDYISANLHGPLPLDTIAGYINVSQRQLLRIMQTALNESLAVYIARQRVERAVMYMQTEEISLSALSAKVGYDNAQSFSKAFKKHFGISPKDYQKQLNNRLLFSTKTTSSKDSILIPVIIEQDEMQLLYIRILGEYGAEDRYNAAWLKLGRFLKENKLLSEDTRYIGISFDDPNVTNPDNCRFYACATVDMEIKPTAEFGTIAIRKGKYAVYTVEGYSESLQYVYDNISVNFSHTVRYGVAFEEYIACSVEGKKEFITKIYIPVK